MIRIGIDVGGTNTDAVLMDGSNVLAGVKAPTSPDVMVGVVEALRKVLAAAGTGADKVDVVMIGTTHFTNAVVQRRDLAPHCRHPPVSARDGQPAADGGLARRPAQGDRQQLVAGPWRQRI